MTERAPRPRVTVHLAVSVDGRIDGFPVDVATYYGLVPTWDEQVTIGGADTVLAAPGMAEDPPDAGPVAAPAAGDGRPALAVVDSRGRVRCWGALLGAGFWRSGLALTAAATPDAHRAYLAARGIEELRTGGDRVDLAAALGALGDRGIERVRIDAGPTLVTHALAAGLVDELSLLVHPVLAGTGRAFVTGAAAGVALQPFADEPVGEGLRWTRYGVAGPAAGAGGP